MSISSTMNLAARGGHARHLLQGSPPVRDVPHAESHRGDIEGTVRERKRLRVTLHKPYAVLEALLFDLACPDFEHRGGEVDARHGDPRVPARRRYGKVRRCPSRCPGTSPCGGNASSR